MQNVNTLRAWSSYYPNLPKRERKLASRGGGWALGSQACIVNKKIKVDKQAELFSMGFYEKIKKQTQ